MRLHRVQIRNFRSIKETDVDFDPACRVLVGINESGKSNILNALALLSDGFDPVKKDDLREALPDEDPIEESLVRFIFKFEKDQSDALHALVSEKIASGAKNPDIVVAGNKRYNVKEFLATRDEGLYTVNIISETKSFRYWRLDNWALLDGWKKPTIDCPASYTAELKGEKYPLSQYRLIRAKDFPDVPDTYWEDASIEDLAHLTGNGITAITKEHVPDALFWEYDENNLLPNSVTISSFANNPDFCVPLKNMFALAGIEDIKASLGQAREGTDNQFQNHLSRIARKTTNHFRAVWKEYKKIEFSLKLNGDQIVPGIKEKNVHDFARRSDGFKRFVTFLLMISVNVKTDNLRDTLLLIDEPDISLHPTGARFLRDELIRISKTNYVVYSTHSIFMIDPGDIGRHYIVKKEDEVTSIESAQESNVAEEEVLYNALGYSVFSILKEKNIIFEGWNDKQLFLVTMENASSDLKKKYKDVGVCNAKGVKTIKAITPLIELAKRKCMIISDSDKTSKEQQRLYVQEKGFGDWKNYQDIDPGIEAVTGEDFVKNDFIASQIKAILSGSTMPPFDTRVLPEKKGKLDAIHKWMVSNGMTSEQSVATLAKIKNAIFLKLKPNNIEHVYTKLLHGISL